MRGQDQQQDGVFSYVNLEERVPAIHPLRTIRKLVDEALGELSPRFEELYASTGRPSIAPEKLLLVLLPHIAEYEKGELLRRNSLSSEERDSPGFLQSQRKRKLVEQSFAWITPWAGFRQVNCAADGGWSGCFKSQPRPTTWCG